MEDLGVDGKSEYIKMDLQEEGTGEAFTRLTWLWIRKGGQILYMR